MDRNPVGIDDIMFCAEDNVKECLFPKTCIFPWKRVWSFIRAHLKYIQPGIILYGFRLG